MGGGECALGHAAVGEETLNYGGDDVEMADAVSDTEQAPAAEDSTAGGGAGTGTEQAEKAGSEGKNKRRKKKGKKNRRRQDWPPTDIPDINTRFILNTCKHLKEKKWHLVPMAVDCLGVTAVSDLVREVEAIQKCGGQTTADGSRLRTGGGILWNILKSREPKAYKEIMTKGKYLEKYLTYIRRPQISRKEDASSQGSALIDAEIESQEQKEMLHDPEPVNDVDTSASDNKAERKPLADRIRIPVAYDDLFEEGEIHEGEPLEAFRRLSLVMSCEAHRNEYEQLMNYHRSVPIIQPHTSLTPPLL